MHTLVHTYVRTYVHNVYSMFCVCLHILLFFLVFFVFCVQFYRILRRKYKHEEGEVGSGIHFDSDAGIDQLRKETLAAMQSEIDQLKGQLTECRVRLCVCVCVRVCSWVHMCMCVCICACVCAHV